MDKKEQLEQELFLIDMKDHHTHEDRLRRDELVRKIKEIESESRKVF